MSFSRPPLVSLYALRRNGAAGWRAATIRRVQRDPVTYRRAWPPEKANRRCDGVHTFRASAVQRMKPASRVRFFPTSIEAGSW